MLEIRRLRAVGPVLALAAILTCAHVWGEPDRGKDSRDLRANLQPKDLTRAFKSKDQLAGAMQVLKDEIPAGAANVKEGISKALASFDGERRRQRLILSLGDGKSTAGPITPDHRARLSDEMV